MPQAPFPLSPSLWAATAAAPPPTERLAESTQADVLVVGGGYAGLSTALHLAERGVRVVLLEAATEVAADGWTVGLIAYDLPYPEPLNTVRPIAGIFGTALLLTPQPTERCLARLDIGLSRGEEPVSRMAEVGLETLRTGNPTARALPLLAALARVIAGGGPETVVLDLPPGGRAVVRVGAPC